MASVAISAGNLLPITRLQAHAAARPAENWTATEWLRAIAGIVGSLLVLGLLGWEVWHIGGQLVQLASQAGASLTGCAPAAYPVEAIWPSGGSWPW